MDSLLESILQYYDADGFDPSLLYSFSGSGMYEEVEVIREVLNPGCHYHNHPTGWTIFVGFNLFAMFIIPFFVSLSGRIKIYGGLINFYYERC